MRLFPLMVSIIVLASPAFAQSLCAQLSGAAVVASDGTFLGTIKSEYASDSIFNNYGSFGSEYSSTSIWNEYGQYGGEYSQMSPFNEYTSSPPLIVMGGKVVAYLSNNGGSHSINPFYLKACARDLY